MEAGRSLLVAEIAIIVGLTACGEDVPSEDQQGEIPCWRPVPQTPLLAGTRTGMIARSKGRFRHNDP